MNLTAHELMVGQLGLGSHESVLDHESEKELWSLYGTTNFKEYFFYPILIGQLH